MSEHRTHRTMGDAYKLVQQLRPWPRLIVTSAAIATQGLELRKKPYRLVQREARP